MIKKVFKKSPLIFIGLILFLFAIIVTALKMLPTGVIIGIGVTGLALIVLECLGRLINFYLKLKDKNKGE